MTKMKRGGPRAALAGVAAAVSLLFSVSACAQPGSGAQGAAAGGARTALSAEQVDSLLNRAEESRMKGAPSAPVTIVEVSDFQCPYCRQFAEQTWAQLDSAYVRTGKVRFLFVHYPLPNHRQAFAASKAALCAGVQGKFWEMHDRIFAAQREWSGQADASQRFARMAVGLGVDAGQWRDCMDNDRVAALIISDIMRASSAVEGTPTFILNGQKAVSGALSFADLSREIDAFLAGTPAEAPPAPPPAQ